MIRMGCIFSPRLYKIYRDGTEENEYQPPAMEKWGDKIITSVSTALNVGLYISPFICMYIYKKGLYSLDEAKLLSHIVGGISCLMLFSYLLRAAGRSSSPKYLEFFDTLRTPVPDNRAYVQALREYDFEFHKWPVTYSVPQRKCSSWFAMHPFANCANMELPVYKRLFLQVLACVSIHTFGIRLIYPGSLGMIQNLLWTPLLHGRSYLVDAYDGERAKIKTAEGNHLDTMFVDNRDESKKGKILVICCEGNSGFYEVGIMTTPLKAGYSVLGWNHPGFAGSTGIPYPSQEQNAIDAVVQYAINELGFIPKDIVLYGWSIGGYTAAWAAATYPEVKALILDATFDDLLPLAINQMPKSWALLVKEVVRSYIDLNVAELVLKYPGPVRLIRRLEDEIISLRPGQLSSNRGNHLTLKIIQRRHYVQLAADDSLPGLLLKYVSLTEPQRFAMQCTELPANERTALRMLGIYLNDYDSTHCTPLPEGRFDAIMSSI